MPDITTLEDDVDGESSELLPSKMVSSHRHRFVWVGFGVTVFLAVVLFGGAAVLSRPTDNAVRSDSIIGLSGADGTCSCKKATDWDGSFGQFASSSESFCKQNFGGPNPYISGGGGDGNNGGWSDALPCKSKQYSFSKEEGWSINVDKSDAQGKGPYRAFAYIQFCNGKQYSECWKDQDTVSFSFSFKTDGLDKIGTYVKLLFWTDSGNIVGLLPPKHNNGKNKFRLLAFPKDDYPNKWATDAEIEDNKWYHIQIDFTPADKHATVFLDGSKVGDGTLPVDMLKANQGPQIGVYSFDYSNQPWSSGFKLLIDDVCIGKTSGECPSGSTKIGMVS